MPVKRKTWIVVLLVLLGLTALVAVATVATSFSRSQPASAPPVTSSAVSTVASEPISSPVSPTATPGLVLTTQPATMVLPTVTPPGLSEPTLPPEALAMQAAPTATPSPIPPPPTPTPTLVPTPASVPITGSDDVEVVEVPAGEFIMGLTFEQARQLNQEWNDQATYKDYSAFTKAIPQLTVYLDTFSIDKFEVTNGRYRRCVEAGVCQPISAGRTDVPENYESDPAYDDYPVRGARWDDAYTYCHWVGKRLPTEAEWEKAARGTDGRLYPWGDEWDPEAGNFKAGDFKPSEPVPVGSYPKDTSPYGVMDMAGNAVEWTADWFRLYPGNPRTAEHAARRRHRVVRGLGFDRWWAVVAVRSSAFPHATPYSYGFRCAEGPPPPDLAMAIVTTTAPAGPEPAGPVDLSEMVYVPAGEFIMGANEGREKREEPQHVVYLDGFYIDKYEVTYSEYAAFLNALGGHRWRCGGHDCAFTKDGSIVMFGVSYADGRYWVKPGYENKPTMDTGWYGARAYCEWAGKRLPIESEWEKAARGTDGRKYPWGNAWDPDRAAGARGYELLDDSYPLSVGSSPGDRSPYGALDMLGNVGEWVADRYDENYYQYSPYNNPQGPETGSARPR